MKSIHVIGAGIAGHEGFTPHALDPIERSEILFGAERLLQLFPEYRGEKVVIDDDNLGMMLGRLVITSYSIHYTKLYEIRASVWVWVATSALAWSRAIR